MKKFIALSLAFTLVLLMLTGCDDPMAKYKELLDSYNVETDFPIGFAPTTGNFNAITRSDTGYYFSTGSMIYYTDYGVMDPIPLCSRPECPHGNTTDMWSTWKCDAFFRGSSAFLQYYEGALYTIATAYSRDDKLHVASNREEPEAMLVRLSLDGSTAEPLAILENWDANGLTAFIHRGYFYTFPNFSFSSDTKITRVPLHDPTSEPEVVLELTGNVSITNSFFYGSRLYFATVDSDDNFFGHVYDLDLNTLRINEIAMDIEGDDRRLSLNGIYQGKPMITAYRFVSGKGYEYNDLYLYDTASGKCELVADLKPYLPTIGSAAVFCDGENPMLYADNGGKISLTALDSTFTPIGEKISLEGNWGSFYPGDDTYSFYLDRDTWNWYFYDKTNSLKGDILQENSSTGAGLAYNGSDVVYVIIAGQ